MAALSKPKIQPARRRSRRHTSPTLVRRLSRHTKVFELSARLSINLFLAGIALTALSRLVPHLQTQAAQLKVVSEAVDQVEASTSKLKSDFGRYFDPWQTQKIMQEQSGYRPSTERQVVWTEEKSAGPGSQTTTDKEAAETNPNQPAAAPSSQTPAVEANPGETTH